MWGPVGGIRNIRNILALVRRKDAERINGSPVWTATAGASLLAVWVCTDQEHSDPVFQKVQREIQDPHSGCPTNPSDEQCSRPRPLAVDGAQVSLLLETWRPGMMPWRGQTTRCDFLPDEYDEESGYTEQDRFFQTLEYHRALLFDYYRRWGDSLKEDTDKASHVDKWPRNVPSSKQIGALESDLIFCKRSSSEGDHKCDDLEFRIATFYVQADDQEMQRKGFKTVKHLAETGHPSGMCYYAMLLNDGKIPGVDANPQQAVVWWRRCVDYHRHIVATYELGNANYLGDGVPENPELAVRLFRRAANLGHPGAAYMLGECLLDGVGIERDRANALEWLVTAAELGHQLARSRVIAVLNEEIQYLDNGRAQEERRAVEASKWVTGEDEAKIRAVNIERRFTIGGGSRNPKVQQRRQTKVAESRGETP